MTFTELFMVKRSERMPLFLSDGEMDAEEILADLPGHDGRDGTDLRDLLDSRFPVGKDAAAATWPK